MPQALTQGGITAPLLRLAFPFFIGQIFSLLTLVIDRLWIGRVGTEALAALGIAQATLMMFFTLLMGVAIGTLAGVSQAVGAKQPERARHQIAQGSLLSLLLGLFFALLSPFAPQEIMVFMEAERQVSQQAAAYLQISMLGLLINGPLILLIFSLQGAGEARAATLSSSISPLVNLFLDPLFIFGLGMGMPGAAWATVLSNITALMVALFSLRRLSISPQLREFHPDFKIAKKLLKIGIPGSLEHLVRTIAGFSLVKILTTFGAIVVSAYTAAMVVLSALIFPGLALGQATASLVGQNLGAEAPKRAWKTAWTGVGLYSGLMSLLGLGIWFGADLLIQAFDRNPLVIREGAQLLRVLVLCFPFIGLALVLSKAFGGAGHTLPAMSVALLAHVIFQLPLVWYLSRAWGPTGAYWGMTIAFILHGTLSGGVFLLRYSRRWLRAH